MRQAIDVLQGVEAISLNFFNSHDVVRHPVVQKIVEAYEEWDEKEQRVKAEKHKQREAQKIAELNLQESVDAATTGSTVSD